MSGWGSASSELSEEKIAFRAAVYSALEEAE
jgi:hypothetical protein